MHHGPRKQVQVIEYIDAIVSNSPEVPSYVRRFLISYIIITILKQSVAVA
jgi:hypothetical protein